MQRNATPDKKKQHSADKKSDGLQALEQANYAVAAQHFSSAIELTPRDDNLYALRATAYYQADLYHNAFRDMQFALTLQPRKAAYNNLMGQIAFSLNHRKYAANCFTQAIKLDKTNPDSYFYRGQLSLHSGNIADAFTDFLKCNKLNPNNPQTLHLLGKTMLFSDFPSGGINQTALDYCQEALTHADDPILKADIYLTMAEHHRIHYQHQNAIKLLNKAVTCNPTSADAYYEKAISLLENRYLADGVKAAYQANRLSRSSVKRPRAFQALNTYSKEDVFKCITELPLHEARPLLFSALDKETILGTFFWTPRGETECDVNSGTLKKINNYLEHADAMRLFKPSNKRSEPFNDVCPEHLFQL